MESYKLHFSIDGFDRSFKYSICVIESAVGGGQSRRETTFNRKSVHFSLPPLYNLTQTKK
jgi:hypothetical protein